MDKPNKNCQSCGMPMKRDANGGGTNADGSKSTTYCSHCFANGQFTLPDITAAEMQERVKGKLVQIGMPRFLTGLFTRGIPKLMRWKKAA